MAYIEIPAHRIAYNVDGTKVGYNTSSDFNAGVTAWCTQTEVDNLNKENTTILSATTASGYPAIQSKCYYFFFTEPKDTKGLLFRQYMTGGNITFGLSSFTLVVEGSIDTTDGVNGTWVSASYENGNPYITSNTDTSFWRTNWKSISFSQLIKALRIKLICNSGASSSGTNSSTVYGALALYGNPAPTAGDYLSILNTDDTVKDRLVDFGDVLEGTNATQSFKLKNNSATKTANTIALSLTGLDAAEFTISTNSTTFAATGSVASLAPGASATVYVKDTKPLGNVGPKQAIFKADVGSWV